MKLDLDIIKILILALTLGFLINSMGWAEENILGNVRISRNKEELKEIYGIAGTSSFYSQMIIRDKTQIVKGRSSFLLKISPELLKEHLVAVESFNVSFGGVNQFLLTGQKTRGKQTGILGISKDPSAQRIYLEYNEETLTLQGAIPVQMHFPQIDEIIPPKQIDYDLFDTRRYAGRISVQFKLNKPLSRSMGAEPVKIAMVTRTKFEFKGVESNDLSISSIVANFGVRQWIVDLFPYIRFEAGRNLCLQPVRFKSSSTDLNPTGAGLAFGMAGANIQWDKADVTFTVREWKTIIDSDLKIVDNSTEEGEIRLKVQDDDCIEIYFIENFNPEDTHGGGGTWASGTASSQIISSDGNATGGIDFTHIAHELGHVLALGHPSGSPGLVSGNTGTLMCPSGWHRDNPTINSQGNKINAENPLLTFTFKLRGSVVDCVDNASCGACPF